MTPQEKLLSTAISQIGYLEKKSNAQLDDFTANSGSGNFNKFAAELDTTDIFNGKKNGYDWCAVFVTWCLYKTFGRDKLQALAGIPAKSTAAGVKYLKNFVSNVGTFHAQNPQPGDIIFFRNTSGSWYHTGLVEKVEAGKVHTIEGNAGKPQGVHRFSYPLTASYIGGYGTPNWEAVAEPEPEPEPAAPAEHTTPAEPGEWSAVAREWAETNGIMNGDQNGSQAWCLPVTKEVLAQVLFNYNAFLTQAINAAAKNA